MKHFEDRRRCPGCGIELHRQPYLMARQATENVIPWTTVAWIVAGALALLLLVGIG